MHAAMMPPTAAPTTSPSSSSRRDQDRAAAVRSSPAPLLLAIAVPLAMFAVQGRVGLGLGDEGFLWYGAQRVLAGELPLRDFQAYDVGRYYWSAAWMWLAGDSGVVVLRAGNAVAACGTVALAALLIRGDRSSTSSTTIGVLTFALWMYPDFKVADSFAALLLVAGLARALYAPGPRGWLLHGTCIGIAGVIGINHALYGVVGLVLGVLYLLHCGWRPDRRAALALAGGVLLGYAPMLALHVAAPGFSAAYVDFVAQLFEAGSTNLQRPLASLGDAASLDWRHDGRAFRTLLKSAFFVAAPCFVLFCAWRLRRRGDGRRVAHPVFAAAVLTSVPYAHYAWSRADLVHVAVDVLPLLVAAWTLPGRSGATARAARWPLLPAGLLVASLVALLPNEPAYQLWRGEPRERVVVGGDALRVAPQVARDLAMLERLMATDAADRRAFYAAPYWPAAYAVASRRSPTWEIYSLVPIGRERQERELRRLVAADIGFAVVSTVPVDGRTDLGFGRTHPILADWLRRCLARTADPAADASNVELFVARNRPCPAP